MITKHFFFLFSMALCDHHDTPPRRNTCDKQTLKMNIVQIKTIQCMKQLRQSVQSPQRHRLFQKRHTVYVSECL